MLDLHLHSTNSDGKLTEKEIIAKLVQNNIDFAVLTDHDTIDGSKEFTKIAKSNGIKTINGVEISCEQEGIGIHVLGYGINPDSSELKKFFTKQSGERKRVFEKYIMLLEKAGFKIDIEKYELFRQNKSVGKSHVFELIWSVPENRDLAIKKYGVPLKEGEKMRSFFIDRLMTLPEHIAFVHKKNAQAKDAIELIHKTGGIAVWAHPGLEIEFKTKGAFEKVFKKLLSLGIDGLEVFQLCYSHTPEWIAHLEKLTKKHNLLPTAGSDDHDGTKIGRLDVPKEYQKEIIEKLAKN